MPVLMIRYQAADDGVAEVGEAIETAFSTGERPRPEGIRYAYLSRSGSADFVALLELGEGAENPLPCMAGARQLRTTVAEWAVGTEPAPLPFDVLDAYRILG